VAVELPPGGGEAVVSDYAPLDQDTGANYDPDLGFDPAALVSLVLGDEREQGPAVTWRAAVGRCAG